MILMMMEVLTGVPLRLIIKLFLERENKIWVKGPHNYSISNGMIVLPYQEMIIKIRLLHWLQLVEIKTLLLQWVKITLIPMEIYLLLESSIIRLILLKFYKTITSTGLWTYYRMIDIAKKECSKLLIT